MVSIRRTRLTISQRISQSVLYNTKSTCGFISIKQVFDRSSNLIIRFYACHDDLLNCFSMLSSHSLVTSQSQLVSTLSLTHLHNSYQDCYNIYPNLFFCFFFYLYSVLYTFVRVRMSIKEKTRKNTRKCRRLSYLSYSEPIPQYVIYSLIAHFHS